MSSIPAGCSQNALASLLDYDSNSDLTSLSDDDGATLRIISGPVELPLAASMCDEEGEHQSGTTPKLLG